MIKDLDFEFKLVFNHLSESLLGQQHLLPFIWSGYFNPHGLKGLLIVHFFTFYKLYFPSFTVTSPFYAFINSMLHWRRHVMSDYIWSLWTEGRRCKSPSGSMSKPPKPQILSGGWRGWIYCAKLIQKHQHIALKVSPTRAQAWKSRDYILSTAWSL